MGPADHLSAELDQPAVGQHGLLDASADPVAGFEDEDVGAGRAQVPCRGETGESGAEHDDIVVHGEAFLCCR